MHPHWLRSERSASASWATPGKVVNGDWPAAEPNASRGCTRINLRKIAIGAGDLSLVFASKLDLLVCVAVPPAEVLRASFEPLVTFPALPCFQPTFELAQAGFDGWIDFAKIPEPIALDTQFVDGGLAKHPEWLPMEIVLEMKFAAEVAKPLIPQNAIVPTVSGNSPQGLLDFDEFPAPANSLTEIRIPANDDAADDTKDGFENRSIASSGGVFGNDIETSPAALDRFVELGDDVAPLFERLRFANDSDDLPIGKIARV